ncbi:hypothetical protein M569_15749 [Genlisea aurea]|uniref:Uncharacterized protein n=1 Tax=Genlisea aurea TaxID=192259 RepID=S8C3T4_9LAMI|nr:hypothetical protein M569_15749 [Genlisea aurea]
MNNFDWKIIEPPDVCQKCRWDRRTVSKLLPGVGLKHVIANAPDENCLDIIMAPQTLLSPGVTRSN